jgi:ribonuclease HI
MAKIPQIPGTAKLFSDANADSPSESFYVAYVDGASRGNPGPAAYALVLQSPDGKTVFELGKYIGRETNNVAEYYGLISALDYATANGINRLHVRSDSELMVKQMHGSYRVKSAELRPLHEHASKLARGLEKFRIEHVPREQNREADRLANLALDRTEVRKTAVSTEGGPVKSPRPETLTSRELQQQGQRQPVTRRVRAHYVAGVLVPFEPLDLPEGAEVSFDLRVAVPKIDQR